jgi:hypothetical protein
MLGGKDSLPSPLVPLPMVVQNMLPGSPNMLYIIWWTAYLHLWYHFLWLYRICYQAVLTRFILSDDKITILIQYPWKHFELWWISNGIGFSVLVCPMKLCVIGRHTAGRYLKPIPQTILIPSGGSEKDGQDSGNEYGRHETIGDVISIRLSPARGPQHKDLPNV